MTIVRKEFVEGLTELEAEVHNLLDLNLSEVQAEVSSMQASVNSMHSDSERITALETTVAELKEFIDAITKEG